MRENEDNSYNINNIINIISKIIDTIGYFGPEILFILSIILLFHTKTLLYVYLLCYFINSIFNIILKGLIKEKRPQEDQNLFNIWLNNGMKHDRHWYDRFGMPSGHAQHVFYYCIA